MDSSIHEEGSPWTPLFMKRGLRGLLYKDH